MVTAVMLLLVGCAQGAVDPPQPAAVPVMPTPVEQAEQAGAAPTAPAAEVTSSAQPTMTLTPMKEAVPVSTAVPTASPMPSPTVTPDPYAALSIDALSDRAYGGGVLQIVETVERTEAFARYQIEYPSDGLNISGFMNVPHEGSEFPVAIVLHGYIPTAEYETLAYTKRYADALAEAGYFVVHPNLRGYPPSDSGPDIFRTGMAMDVLNLIAIIQEQSLDETGPLRRANGEEIHLWGHSMGGGVALRVITVNNDEAIKSAVLYGSMSGDEVLNYGRIVEWSGGRRGDVELSVPQETLETISPINYLQRIQAAISIHHSDADDVVPLAWSEDLCRRLEEIGQPVECYTYHGAPHTFNGVWDEVFIERFIRFFDWH